MRGWIMKQNKKNDNETNALKSVEIIKNTDEKSSFKIFSYKKWISRIFWTIVCIALAAFIIRVAIWENNYYKSKEGSVRATVISSNTEPAADSSDVDISEISEQDIKSYTVAADSPRYLSIEKLGISNARIIEIGTKSSGELESPKSIHDVGWYKSSAKPGAGGASLFDGHSGINVPGVFNKLKTLAAGDVIEIEMGDGTVYDYIVYSNNSYPIDEANSKIGSLLKTI